MGRNRVSGTTILFAVVLFAALIGIGMLVDPKPPGPPEPPKAQNTGAKVTAQDAMKSQKEMMQKRMEMMKAHGKEVAKGNNGKPAPKPPVDPNAIDINSDYFRQNQMGEKGEEEMAKKVAVSKEMMAKQREESLKAQKSSPPAAPPLGTPGMPPGAPPAQAK